MIRTTPDYLNEIRSKIASFGPKGEFLLWAIDQGWHLIRLRRVMRENGVVRCTCDEGERCPGPGKHPRDLVSQPLDPNNLQTLRVVAQRLQQDPDAGFGVHLGLSGLVALDVDTKNDGLANWSRLQADLDLSQLEPFTVSGSGGPHYLFQAPANCDERRGWMGPNGETLCQVKIAGVGDFKSGQGFVVVPFSAHRSGGIYTRAGGPVYAELPAELAELVNADKKFTAPAHTPSAGTSSATAWAAPGAKTPIERAVAYLANVPGAVSGQRGHDATYKVARLLVKDFALTIDDAFPLFALWNDRCDPPWAEADLLRKLEEADRNPGPVGRLLNATYERPLSAEDQWLRDACLRISWGKKVIVTGPGDSIARTEYAPGWDPGEIDLGDVAAAPIAAEVTAPPPATPGDGADCASPATEDAPAVTAADDGWPEEGPRPPCQSCPHAIPVVMVNSETKKGAIFRFPCRRLSCPWCRTVKLDHWKATVKHHIAELIVQRRDLDTEPVYLLRVRRGAWLRVSAFIRASGGDFFRLDYQATSDGPGDAYMVLSTVRPHGADVTPYTPEAARDRFCEAIDALPCDVRGRLFASSHGWKLLPDGEPSDKQWAKVCRITTGESTTEKILAKHGRAWRYARGTARWWQWNAVVFSIAGVDFPALVEDLDIGTAVSGSRWRFTVGTRPDEPDDEWATPADPPPTVAAFVLDLQ